METYSDAYQDIFVLKLIQNIGFYLDLGCSDGFDRSNSFLLEKNGWTGILCDYNNNQIDKAKNLRTKSKCFCLDLSKHGIEDILIKNNCPKIIDYVSLDVDEYSLDCLLSFPLKNYRFKFLTFEHDIYANREDCFKRKNITPNILKEYGYSVLCENVKCNGLPYEDWFVDSSFFDKSLIEKFKNNSNMEYKLIYKNVFGE